MKKGLPAAVVVIAALVLAAHGPIHQFADYNDFADKRAWLGIPNAANVLSSIPFLLIGAWGLARPPGAGWRLFFIGMALTAIGSTWYHLAPDDDRLFWDRLPIGITCAGLLTAYRGERREGSAPWFAAALIALAIASTAWWRETGDLRPYILLQGAPALVIPLWQWIHRSPARDRIAFGVAIGLYAAAKAFEFGDRAVFDVAGLSGHTIKHLLAAAAALVLARKP